VAVVGLGVAWAPLLQLTARAADSF
jgi:hypothetical protein